MIIFRFLSLISTRVKIYILSCCSIIVFLFFALFKAFRYGCETEKNKSKDVKIGALEARSRNDRKVDSYSSDDVKSELSKWVRK